MEDQKSTFQCSNSKGNAREIRFRSRVNKKYAHNKEFFLPIQSLLFSTLLVHPLRVLRSFFRNENHGRGSSEREREGKREGLLMVGLRGVLQKLESSKAPARLESAAERNDRAYE